MEDTLRDMGENEKACLKGLNPCFNGRYSQRSCKVSNDEA